MLVWAPGSRAAPAETESDSETSLDCVINPSVIADLGSGVPGILDRVLVDRADHVEAGQVVAELDSGVELASRDLARVRADKDTEIDLRRVNAAFGARQNERTRDLFERKVISTNDMDERKTEAQLASIQLRQAVDNKEIAQLELERAEQVLKRRTIKSPIAGVVMERFKTIGEYVDEQPVLRIAQLNPLHVEVFVPVERLGEIRPGMQAEVWSDAVKETHWLAKVSRVDLVADIASGTYGVRLVLPNPDYRVPAGLRCRLSFTGQDESPVAAVDTVAPPQAPAVAEEPIAKAADTAAAEDAVPETAALSLSAQSAVADDGVATESDAVDRQTPSTGGTAVAAADVADVDEKVCLRSGPYPSRTAARRVARDLEAFGLDVRVDAFDDQETKGYRVVSEWIADRGAVDAYIERLKQAGISDFFTAPGKPVPLRVNLGMYTEPASATRRVDELAARGITAYSVAWAQAVRRFVLTASGTPTPAITKHLADLPVPTAPGSCDQLAGR